VAFQAAQQIFVVGIACLPCEGGTSDLFHCCICKEPSC